jgi:uncharacterized membrane protein
MNIPSQIMGALVGILCFFGLGLLGLAILALSARLSQTRRQVLFWGIIGAGLTAVDSFFLIALAGINSATSSSQSSYHFTGWIVVFFIVCVFAYCLFVPGIVDRRRRK